MTILLLQNNYIYVMPDGTRVESEVPREDLKVHQVPATTSTTTVSTSAPIISDDVEGSALADDYSIQWEEDYKEDTKDTPP